MKKYFSFIKFSHTVFALPFAVIGYFLAISQSEYSFSWKTFLLVVACMICARSAAMGFNRYADRMIDAKNPRTATREIPAGKISSTAAFTFVIFFSILFVVCTWFINPLCFYLSPIALLVVLGYSYTKRFTWLCHFVLGAGLALAPVGAYLAVTGHFALAPVLLGFTVLTWVAGFDIIYALQDEEFDKSKQLYSVPAMMGKKGALRLSEIIHAVTAILLLSTVWLLAQSLGSSLGWIIWTGTTVFLSLLIYQHTLVKTSDLRRVNLAFFTTNGIASLIFGTLAIIDLMF